jgi:hypothetical protein
MQTRNVPVFDRLGKRLKTYPIAIPEREGGPRDPEFAEAVLERARNDKLVAEHELHSLTAQVPQKIKLWRQR